MKDRIISDLWKKYKRAESDYNIANQDIESWRRNLQSSMKDRDVSHHWMNFYKKELEKLGVDVDKE